MSILRSNIPANFSRLFKDDIGKALTKEEAYAINQYKNSGSWIINDMYRNFPENEIPDNIKQQADNISKALLKAPIFKGDVFRRINLDEVRKMRGEQAVQDLLDQHATGKTIEYPAFTSTSKSIKGFEYEGTPDQIVMRINSKSGRDVTGFPGVEGEQEVLFDRGFKGKVINSGKQAGCIYWFDVDEIIDRINR